jgi:hypothetical protein
MDLILEELIGPRAVHFRMIAEDRCDEGGIEWRWGGGVDDIG